MHVFGDQLQVVNIIMSWVIIRYKSSEDVLTGVSKLDELLKVSCFQKYKIELKLEDGKSEYSQFEALNSRRTSLQSKDFKHALDHGVSASYGLLPRPYDVGAGSDLGTSH